MCVFTTLHLSFSQVNHALAFTSLVLPVNDELIALLNTVGKYEALAWLCGGLSCFAGLGLLAVWNNKASKIPFAPKVYPYDNLRVELGGEP
nr:nadh dehydrogenase [ubiquinone] 1 beta subcomplex subunit 8, mitochondrial [Quercus suber]